MLKLLGIWLSVFIIAFIIYTYGIGAAIVSIFLVGLVIIGLAVPSTNNKVDCKENESMSDEDLFYCHIADKVVKGEGFNKWGK